MQLKSPAYMISSEPHCFKLPAQDAERAFSLALFKAGSSIAARMAMIAITTKSSIRVNNFLSGMIFLLWFAGYPDILCCNFAEISKRVETVILPVIS